MQKLPDFMIIGAMKCATSTLHEQLARQPGIFMCTPKEPYFFSDDPIYAKGMAWYEALFASADASDLCGESTTHYTKLPTYPQTISRIEQHVPNATFVYVMRHPIDRLVSQYIHQWTEREITVPIDEAVRQHPELIAYSKYSYQLAPYFAQFGRNRVLPVFFDRLRNHSQTELERVCRFIGYAGEPIWDESDQQRNVSSQRMRVSPWRDRIVYSPLVTAIRKRLIPQNVRDRIKQGWQMQERPTLSEDSVAYLTEIFNADLSVLGDWLSIHLTCENFKEVTSQQSLNWINSDATI
ncbi:MAG: sulfotransferase family protein [Candidatus Promineifilaceae bacterium]